MHLHFQYVPIFIAAISMASHLWAGEIYCARAKMPASTRCWCKAPDATYETSTVEATVRIVTVATGNQLEAIATAGLSNSKYFFPQPPQQNFATSGIVFDRIGVAIFDNGSCNCTGRLQYDGGHDKVFHGANVLVKVRAFAGPPGSPDTTLEGMRLVFQTQKRIWVRRDGEIMTSLIPTQVDSASTYAATSNYTVSANYTNYLPALVQQDFNRITHVEIVFHYMHEM